MSVLVEGPWVDRRRPGPVASVRPAVGRHAAAGSSPEIVGLLPSAAVGPRGAVTAAGPHAHLEHDDEPLQDGSPLVRELEAVTGRMAEHGPLVVLRAELRALLGAWAAALLRLHRTPVSAATPTADVPWVLVEPLPTWLDDLPPQCGTAWAVRAHPAVRRAVERTRAGWAAAQWTHGDPTGDEVVVSRSRGTTRATLLGPTDGPVGANPARHPASGRGDARWDVATVLDWLAVALGPVLDPAWHLDPVTVFLDEYRALGGTAVPSREMAVARTLATAVEWTAQLVVADEPDDESHAWLRGLWGRPLELASSRVP